MKKVLLVDDELDLIIEIQRKLERARFRVELAQDVESALDLVHEKSPDENSRDAQPNFDVVILELNLKENCKSTPNPEYGTGLIRQLRAAGIKSAIFVHSAMSSELHVTASLDAGADEYIIKRGESFRLLLARIQAHFRREERLTFESPTTRWVATNMIKVDRNQRELTVGNKLIELSVQQTKIMAEFAANPSRIFTSDELLKIAWGKDVHRDTSAADTMLYRLRLKFKQARVQDLIESIRGHGYRLVVTNDGSKE